MPAASAVEQPARHGTSDWDRAGQIRQRRSIEPFDVLLIVITFGAAVTILGSIYDINDLFWHILIGDQIRAGVPIADVGANFTFAYDNPGWRTGAWASEYL